MVRHALPVWGKNSKEKEITMSAMSDDRKTCFVMVPSF
jgi:hypothetical protein